MTLLETVKSVEFFRRFRCFSKRVFLFSEYGVYPKTDSFKYPVTLHSLKKPIKESRLTVMTRLVKMFISSVYALFSFFSTKVGNLVITYCELLVNMLKH